MTGTIILTSGSLVINKDLNIQGPGAALLTVSGNNSVNVFAVRASLVMSGLTIANGKVGISRRRTFRTYDALKPCNNAKQRRRHIRTQSDISVSNCTITANGGSGLSADLQFGHDRPVHDQRQSCSTDGGGGIYLHCTTSAIVTNCTIANNSATDPRMPGAAASPFCLLQLHRRSQTVQSLTTLQVGRWRHISFKFYDYRHKLYSSEQLFASYPAGGGIGAPGCFFKTPSWLATT